MKLSRIIQKQNHSESLIAVRDLGLTVSIKTSSSSVEKNHDAVFPVTVVILLVTCFNL